MGGVEVRNYEGVFLSFFFLYCIAPSPILTRISVQVVCVLPSITKCEEKGKNRRMKVLIINPCHTVYVSILRTNVKNALILDGVSMKVD